MRYGAHLPLIDFGGVGWTPSTLASYVDAARDLGYDFITVNDHLAFARPWLDGLVALASVVERSGDMRLATTVSLPVIRGPAALAKAATALDVVSGGRFVLGVGPGSSATDYEIAGVDFEKRWAHFDDSVRTLRAHLGDTGDGGSAGVGRPADASAVLEPTPAAGRPPIWIGSWGSEAGLRRVARLGDGWLASAYNTTPESIADARVTLAAALDRRNKDPDGFPCSLASMWTYVTGDAAVRDARLRSLADMLNRPVDAIEGRVLVGSPETCAGLLRRHEAAGVDNVFVWPLADNEEQLDRVIRDVAPMV
jgi:alkanesulfonate monooxygenase SsuD/methylene tetrahydromethanopterin reductase-like flavin-dependent oxidoreductase (luciferase family)